MTNLVPHTNGRAKGRGAVCTPQSSPRGPGAQSQVRRDPLGGSGRGGCSSCPWRGMLLKLPPSVVNWDCSQMPTPLSPKKNKFWREHFWASFVSGYEACRRLTACWRAASRRSWHGGAFTWARPAGPGAAALCARLRGAWEFGGSACGGHQAHAGCGQGARRLVWPWNAFRLARIRVSPGPLPQPRTVLPLCPAGEGAESREELLFQMTECRPPPL